VVFRNAGAGYLEVLGCVVVVGGEQQSSGSVAAEDDCKHAVQLGKHDKEQRLRLNGFRWNHISR
jgi:hypothetical protein